MHGTTVTDAFRENLENQPFSGITLKYNTVRVYPRFKHFVFVEGNSDMRFYGKTKYSELSEGVYYLYANSSERERGKNAVRKAYEEIENNNKLCTEKNKCIFIVDRDWDALPGKPLLVTLGHSMENYFFVRENLDVLFTTIGADKTTLEDFWTLFCEFAYETSLFWALKATVVFARKNNLWFNYRKTHDFDSVFSFEYIEKKDSVTSHGITYDKSKMQDEILAMHNGIMKNPDLIKYCEKRKKDIEENPLLVRGHDAFHFLQCYLSGRFGRTLDFYSQDDSLIAVVIPKFSVDLV